MDHSLYQRPEPYPVPKDLTPDIRTARILLNSFAGPTSELTAVHQYIYHHLEAAEKPKVSACLRGIAIVEMRHLDLLGGCIRQLGVSPKYRSFQGNVPLYWHGRNVFYGCKLRDMINADIQNEYDAISLYQMSLRNIGDRQIQTLLHRIIEDEKLHIQLLQELLDTL